jgi:hypothetical protein
MTGLDISVTHFLEFGKDWSRRHPDLAGWEPEQCLITLGSWSS